MVPYTLSPVSSNVNILQNYNTTMNVLTLIQSTDFIHISPVLLVLICVSVCLCLYIKFYAILPLVWVHVSITIVKILNNSNITKILHVALLNHLSPLSLSVPVPNPWQLLTCPLFLKLWNFKMLYK